MDHLVQGRICHDALEALVFCLEFLQPFELVTGHAAILFAPAVLGLHRNANLSNGLLNRLALTLQYHNLPQLQNDVLRLVSLTSHLRVLQKVG
jgi:hypothetical protein